MDPRDKKIHAVSFWQIFGSLAVGRAAGAADSGPPQGGGMPRGRAGRARGPRAASRPAASRCFCLGSNRERENGAGGEGGWWRWREGGGVYGEGGGRDVKRRCSRVAAAAVLDPRPGPFSWRWGFPQTSLPRAPSSAEEPPPARRSLRRAASWGRREGGSGGGQGPRARFRRRCRLPGSCRGLWLFTFSQYTHIICNLCVFLCMYT